MKVTDQMIDRFLAWPVPADVYPDGVAGKEGRIGTNLLTAIQARAMLEYVLAAVPEVGARPDNAGTTDRWEDPRDITGGATDQADGDTIIRRLAEHYLNLGRQQAAIPSATLPHDVLERAEQWKGRADDAGFLSRAILAAQKTLANLSLKKLSDEPDRKAIEVEVIDPYVMDLVRKHGSTMTNSEIVQKFLPKERLANASVTSCVVVPPRLIEDLRLWARTISPISAEIAQVMYDATAWLERARTFLLKHKRPSGPHE